MSRDQGRYLLIVALLLIAVGATLWITLGRPLGASTAEGHEFVADIERDQGLRAVRSHQIDRRDFVVAGEAQDRELAVVGDFRWLKIARTLDLVIQIARSIDDAMVEGAPDGARLQRGNEGPQGPRPRQGEGEESAARRSEGVRSARPPDVRLRWLSLQLAARCP